MSNAGKIEFFAGGFRTVRISGKEERATHWSEVARINGGLKDLVTTDQVYFHLFSEQQPTQILITEDIEGVGEFQATIFHNWPEIEPAWRSIFARSPFGVHYLTIWERGQEKVY